MDEIYSDDMLRTILRRTQRIAVVGMSTNEIRPSYYVGRYLSLKGYDVVPINPGKAGETVFDRQVLASLEDVEGKIDMIDVFRRSEHVLPIVETALKRFPRLQTIWMQIGVWHLEAAETARAKGIDVVMNRCPKIEYQRLFGELRMAGINTGIISSKL
ncbi:MAG: CoA-binding protein [Pseudomonadota bacterium]